jgi:tetratricopeptide (TPR) repeat protein
MDWESRLAALWAEIDDLAEADFHERMRQLAAEFPPGNAIATFELAAAQDSTGHPDEAVPLYRAAIAAGLVGTRRRRANIQLASSLRNLGEIDEAISLLEAEMKRESSDLDDAVRAVLALAYSSAGRDREGLALVLEALAAHLPRYQRSMANYARALGSTRSGASE